jgi:hypothetical protein
MFLIGTDEAGYGPNLGPLIVSMTIWDVPDALAESDLYELLRDVVVRKPADEDANHLLIADSKQVYKPGGGLAALERGVLTMLQVLGKQTATWRDAWTALAPDSLHALDERPWYTSYNPTLPLDALPHRITDLQAQLTPLLATHGIRLLRLESVAIFPASWNHQLDAGKNKATILAEHTLQLVQRGVGSLPVGPIRVQCDKFGGRNRYAHLLQDLFPEYLVEIRRESRPLSVYQWGPPDTRVECRFAAKGETFLPAALASMASKYLRELAMLAFNHFWRRYLPGIRATAGYPVDARRFKAEIETVRQQLGIDEHLIWRNK